MSTEPPVTVAIDESRASWTALTWAIAEARRSVRPLQIVHVAEPGSASASAEAKQRLADATRAAATEDPALVIDTRLLFGEAANVLIEISRSCAVLVVGRHPTGLAAMLHRSVAHRLVEHAHCPVVLVSEVYAEKGGQVIVGVPDGIGGRSALEFAFAEASRRDTGVLAVRSMMPNGWEFATTVASTELWRSENMQSRDRTYVVTPQGGVR